MSYKKGKRKIQYFFNPTVSRTVQGKLVSSISFFFYYSICKMFYLSSFPQKLFLLLPRDKFDSEFIYQSLLLNETYTIQQICESFELKIL